MDNSAAPGAPKLGIMKQIVYHLLYVCIIYVSLMKSVQSSRRDKDRFCVLKPLWMSAGGSTWSGMRGCSSSMSIKTSPQTEWGISPAHTHTAEKHTSFLIRLFYWPSLCSHHTYVSIHVPRPPLPVPPQGCSDIPPGTGPCTDQPRASSQTDGCRWLWWQWAACKGPPGEASAEMRGASCDRPTQCWLVIITVVFL